MTSQRSVLVVDDDSDNRESLAELLQVHGYAATTAADGDEGFRLAVEKPPTAIILDIMMPKVGGFEAVQRLKSDQRTREVPVVCLTGLTNMRELAIQLGFAAYLVKPVPSDRLLQVLESLLDPVGSC
jgi:two-component system cell cycle response regulator